MGKKQKQKQKEKKFNSDTDSEFDKQLRPHGFTIKTMLGDGNCLFRSFCDQLEGHSRNHMQMRLKIVDYIKEHRDDFEPFIEDDVTFDDHISALTDNGTYGGNDSIVAFSRIHNATVYIHQFNSPAFVVHANEVGKPKGKDIHISYHNGDHYNSVVKVQSSNTEVKVNNDENGANSVNKNTGGGNNKGSNNRNKSNVTSNRKQNNKTGNSNKKSPDETKDPHIESLKINEESKNNCDENSEKENASNAENVTNTPAKPKALSRRQKLDLKKKERKQEALQRKRSTFDGSSSSSSVSNSFSQHDNLFKASSVKTLSI